MAGGAGWSWVEPGGVRGDHMALKTASTRAATIGWRNSLALFITNSRWGREVTHLHIVNGFLSIVFLLFVCCSRPS